MMAPSRHSSSSSISSEAAENECFNFIVNKLVKYQPLNLNTLYGHVSVLPKNVRNFVGKDNADLKRFLKSYPDTFKVNGKGKVSLLKGPKELGLCDRGSSICSGVSDVEIPPKIENGEGVITRLFAAYGFFEVKYPLQTSVYFSAACFGEPHKKTLLSVIRVGQRVGFNAKLGQEQNSAQYRATDVWLIGDSESDTEEVVNERSGPNRKKRNNVSTSSYKNNVSTSNYKNNVSISTYKNNASSSTYKNNASSSSYKNNVPSNSYKNNVPGTYKNKVFTKGKTKEEKEPTSEAQLEVCLGKIQNIYDTYGFISKENDERIFFHLNAVIDRRKSPNTSDLRKLFKKGDPVQFSAVPSVKKASVPWQATSVWLDSSEPDTVNSGEELFVSTSDENDETPVGSNASDASHSQAAMKNASSSSAQSLSDADECILNYHGKIYPNTDNTAEIKFGTSYHSSAMAETCDFYINGSKVSDLMWEFNERDNVQFDAVKIKIDEDDSYWKATLVWVGRKPILPKCNSDDSLNAQSEKRNNSKALVSDKNQSKFGTSKYTNWGDTPYSDEEEEKKAHKENSPIIGSKATKNILVDAGPVETELNKVVASSNKNSSHMQAVSPIPILPAFLHVKQDNQIKVNDVQAKGEPKHHLEKELPTAKEAKKNSDEENVEVGQKNTPGVYMFQKCKGQVMKMYRYMAQIRCESLLKPTIALLLNDMYCNGKLFKDVSVDPRELLFVDDLVYFNGFEVVADDGKVWQKVTLAWKGDKPEDYNRDMEPKEFIELEKLKVTVPIPCWKSFRNKVKQDSIEMMNATHKRKTPTNDSKTTPAAGRRFLTAVEPEENANQNASGEAAAAEGDEEDGGGEEDFDERKYFYQNIQQKGVPESLVYQFTNITNSMNALRRNFASFATLKDFDSLASDIDNAIEAVLNHLSSTNIGNEMSKNSDGQTDQTSTRTQNAENERIAMTSTASQTLVTGDVIARDLFPQ